MRKIIWTCVALIILALLGWQIYQQIGSQSQEVRRQRKSMPVAVEVAAVRRASVQDVGRYSGTLYPQTAFSVAPKIAGRLEKIYVHIGDEVRAGQLVAALDDAEYRQQVSQAQAELEVAQANLIEQQNMLADAKREYDRAVALREKKIIPETQLDEALSDLKSQEAKLKVAVARVSQSEAAMQVANVRLEYTRIQVPENNDPVHRVVGERFVDEGAMLAPNTAIISVIDIGRLIAAIHVIERDYPKMKIGLRATITTDAYPDRLFSGRIIRIAPILKEKSREARIEIGINNPEKLLKPGMFVRVQIQFEKRDNVIVVPIAAIIKRNNAQGVFLVSPDDKTAAFTPVTVGIVNTEIAEIREPIINGNVIILGQHLLEDGAPVIISKK